MKRKVKMESAARVEQSKRKVQIMSSCRYCGKLAASDGSTIHAGNCAGLKSLDFTQLQHDFLTDRIADLLRACRSAEGWLSGWASAEPYIDILRSAIAKASDGNCPDCGVDYVPGARHFSACPSQPGASTTMNRSSVK